MNPRRLRFRLLLPALLVGSLLAVLFYRTLTGPRAILSDGREIAVKAVAFGTNHFYTEGKSWVKLIRSRISVSRAHQLGLRSYRIGSTTSNLVVWAHCYWPSNQWPTNRDSLIVAPEDRFGLHAEPRHWSLAGGGPIPNRHKSLVIWQVSQFPRRRATVDLGIYSVDARYRPHRVGSVRVENPARGDYPVWSATSLPVTNRQDETEFALLNLVSGVPVPDAMKSNQGWFGARNHAVFSLRGGDARDWRVSSVEARDATGNVWHEPGVESLWVGEYLWVAFAGALWSEEPAWRVRFEFDRLGGYQLADTVAVSAFALPANQSGTAAQSVGASLHGLFLTNCVLTRNIYPSLPRQNFHLKLNVDMTGPPVRVRLANATDDRGRAIRFVHHQQLSPHLPLWGLDVPDGAASVNLTFAAHPSRFLEFTVRPNYWPTNQAGTKH